MNIGALVFVLVQVLLALFISRRAGQAMRNGWLFDLSLPKLSVLVFMVARVWLFVLVEPFGVVAQAVWAVLTAIACTRYIIVPLQQRARKGVMSLPVERLAELMASIVASNTVLHVTPGMGDRLISLKFQSWPIPIISVTRRLNCAYRGCVHCAMLRQLQAFEHQMERPEFRGITRGYADLVAAGKHPNVMINIGNKAWGNRYYRYSTRLTRLVPALTTCERHSH